MKAALYFCLLISLLMGGQASVVFGQKFRPLAEHRGQTQAVAWHPTRAELATGGTDGQIMIHHGEENRVLRKIANAQQSGITTLAFNPGGNLLAAGDQRGCIRLYELGTGRVVKELCEMRGPVEGIAWSPDGGSIVGVGPSGQARIWDLLSSWHLVLNGHTNNVYGVAWSPDGKHVVTSGSDLAVVVWDPNSGQRVALLSGQQNTVRSLKFSPDGAWLAAGGLDGNVRLYETRNWSMVTTMKGADDFVRSVSFSPDSRALVGAARNGRLLFWEVPTGRILHQINGTGASLWGVAFSADGKMVANAQADGKSRIWDVGFLNLGSGGYQQFLPSEQRFAPPIDLAKRIPLANRTYNNRFALVIGNEFYDKAQSSLEPVSNVSFARQDALIMKAYLEKALGIPERNILLRLDATAGGMRQELEKLRLLAKNAGPDAELFVYYAGHGIPHPNGSQPLLLPVDIGPGQPELAIPLQEVLNLLAEGQHKSWVFLDACFSGIGRDGPVVSTRSVRILPKAIQPLGRTVVVSGAGEREMALPYTQARHGLFTYFLLKSLVDKDISIDFGTWLTTVSEEVALHALLLHNRSQKVSIVPAAAVAGEWEKEWLVP